MAAPGQTGPDNLVLRRDEGTIAILTLNAPARLNALSMAMLQALDRALDGIGPSTRAIILQGGPRAFSAGHDLAEIQSHRNDPDGGEAAYRALFDRCSALMQRLTALPQPVIAEVAGIATAAGCQLAASCDLVVAAETARFGVNGIAVGLFCATPMVALTRRIAPGAALDHLMTGDLMDAPRALALGLASRVVPAADLSEATLTLARRIAARPPAALALGKAAFQAIQGQSLAEAYRTAGATICANLMRPETAEGLQAFLEKRKPDWE